jgi:hypothetical protein
MAPSSRRWCQPGLKAGDAAKYVGMRQQPPTIGPIKDQAELEYFKAE